MNKENLISDLKTFEQLITNFNADIRTQFKLQIDITKKEEHLILPNQDVLSAFNINKNITCSNMVASTLCSLLNNKEAINDIINKYRSAINNLQHMKEIVQFKLFIYNLTYELVNCEPYLVLLLPTIAESYSSLNNWEDYYEEEYSYLPIKDIKTNYSKDNPDLIHSCRAILHFLLGKIQIQLDYIYMFSNDGFPVYITNKLLGKENKKPSMFSDTFFISNVSIECKKKTEESHTTFYNAFDFIYTYPIPSLTELMYVYVQQFFITKFNLRKCSSPYCNKYFVCYYAQQRYCSDKCRSSNQRFLVSTEKDGDNIFMNQQKYIYPPYIIKKCNCIEQRFRDNRDKYSNNKSKYTMLNNNLKKFQNSKNMITQAKRLAFRENNISRLEELNRIFDNYINIILKNLQKGIFRVKSIVIPNNSLK